MLLISSVIFVKLPNIHVLRSLTKYIHLPTHSLSFTVTYGDLPRSILLMVSDGLSLLSMITHVSLGSIFLKANLKHVKSFKTFIR